MKRDGSGNAMRRFPGMPRKAVPDGGKMLCGERGRKSSFRLVLNSRHILFELGGRLLRLHSGFELGLSLRGKAAARVRAA